MCCGQASRPSSQAVKQSEPTQQKVAPTVKQSDTGNPVNKTVTNSTNITRANEVNRNSYHQQHFGGR